MNINDIGKLTYKMVDITNKHVDWRMKFVFSIPCWFFIIGFSISVSYFSLSWSKLCSNHYSSLLLAGCVSYTACTMVYWRVSSRYRLFAHNGPNQSFISHRIGWNLQSGCHALVSRVRLLGILLVAIEVLAGQVICILPSNGIVLGKTRATPLLRSGGLEILCFVNTKTNNSEYF